MPEITDEQRDRMLERIVTVVAEIRKMAELVAPAIVAAVAQMKEAMDGLREAGLLDEDYKPIKPTDRPA
ncbi:hypothetical protein [Streptomyces cylindrosporus]|uniref:Uncharacterized protein n=1 Tax=Streptomyces cylindrosporus TaxID=2927583 RepID=A0ABS9Y2I1_9ACTN|nr:hypothetical protein [Streptomyces cylindrosporus]MCI3271418.1 hypothetical protein [Streptomyces cylindrosporus]